MPETVMPEPAMPETAMAPDETARDDAADRSWRRHAWLGVPIVVLGVLAYLNSFAGVFLFDDLREIVNNPRVGDLGEIWSNRPLVRLSLAINHRAGGLSPWGYHLVNLVVHLLAGVTLFGVVGRTLRLEPFRRSCGAAAPWLAFIIASIWVVHPLQTESVTYIIQRAESMMALFYLLTLYCVLRGSAAPRPLLWYAAAVAACGLGMGSKSVMVTAPVVVFLFDWTMLTGSPIVSLRRRWGLHAGLAATWSILALTGIVQMVFFPAPDRLVTAGFGVGSVTPLQYALTQPGVLVQYVRLALWPGPLCFDYAWPIADSIGAVLLPSALVGGVLAACVWSLRRRAWLGFLGLAFFILLSPTSSIVPIADAAVEHRMYLPLALVVTAVVIGARWALAEVGAVAGLAPTTLRAVTIVLVSGTVMSLGLATVERNRDYHSQLAMWSDVVVKRPSNPHPYNELGNMLTVAGQVEEAIEHYRMAMELDPTDHVATNNLANALLRLGRVEDAITCAEAALQRHPDYAPAHSNLGNALTMVGRIDEGVEHLRRAVVLDDDDAWSRSNLARALALQAGLATRAPADGGGGFGPDAAPRVAEAMEHLREALRLDPQLEEATNYLAMILHLHDDIDGTVASLGGGVRLERAHALAHVLQGEVARQAGRSEAAAAAFRRALEIEPGNLAARQCLQNLDNLTAAETE